MRLKRETSKKTMELRPSEICYSQDSINVFFRCNRRIGFTLDEICERRTDIMDIPVITVKKIDDRWVTWDNRRLWVFRHLERLGKCDKIPVEEVSYCETNKMTSTNKGVSVEVRGNPGGKWYQRFPDGSDGYNEIAEETATSSESSTDSENESDEDDLAQHFEELILDA